MVRTDGVDVVVIGGGVIGLACALVLIDRGASVRIITRSRPGEASPAAGGILCPSIEQADGPAQDFGVASRDRYPSYVAGLAEATGIAVPLNRDGVLQVAITRAGVRGLQRSRPATSQWLSQAELADIEPALGHGLGAVLHPLDGAVDNVVLLAAMLQAVLRRAPDALVGDDATGVRFDAAGVTVLTSGGLAISAAQVGLCAGAWSTRITGLVRPIPIEPVRGEMLAYPTAPVRRAVFGPTGYLVPRTDGRCLAGSTAEYVGFDASTTDGADVRIRRAATEICPGLAGIAPTEHWAGLRPMTPDMLPIIGRDPDEPRLIYACGHSRNGVLMAPLTGDCVGAIASGEPPPISIDPFRVARFFPGSHF